MYSSLRMTTFIPFLLTIFVSTIIAYPAKIDPNEAFYFNRFHYFPDGYDGKDVRNLDGIDQRGATYEDYGMRLVDRTNGNSGGGDSTEYRLHNPLSLLFAQTPSDSSMHIDGIGGGHLVRNLASAARQGGGNLLRDLDQLRNNAAFYARQNRNINPLDGDTLGSSKRSLDILAGHTIGSQKRNMDEIDRAGFNSFIKKRNFDEIDHTGFDGFVKRNFDEIDRVGFGSFVKRDAGPYPSHVAVPTHERMRN